jgi:hypothetical protein
MSLTKRITIWFGAFWILKGKLNITHQLNLPLDKRPSRRADADYFRGNKDGWLVAYKTDWILLRVSWSAIERVWNKMVRQFLRENRQGE